MDGNAALLGVDAEGQAIGAKFKCEFGGEFTLNLAIFE